MKEIYTLNSDPLPWPPVPHDCLITDIRIQDRVLEFTFEEDISCHDSIKVLKPGAKSLVMRFNLCGDPYDQENLLIRLESAIKLRWWNPWKPFSPIQRCRILDNKKLPGLTKGGRRLGYIDHFISRSSGTLIVRLSAMEEIQMEMYADVIEYEWIT